MVWIGLYNIYSTLPQGITCLNSLWLIWDMTVPYWPCSFTVYKGSIIKIHLNQYMIVLYHIDPTLSQMITCLNSFESIWDRIVPYWLYLSQRITLSKFNSSQYGIGLYHIDSNDSTLSQRITCLNLFLSIWDRVVPYGCCTFYRGLLV